MAALAPSSLSFKVRRRQPELVAPAKPTPLEVKLLSDIDNQGNLRYLVPVIQFYRGDPSMRGRDVVEIMRKALADTLVFYYPFAGRLREGHNGKLMVDCTGDGVVFIEADADVTLDDFGDLHPPIPCYEELLYDVPGTSNILNAPLLLIQVTRLKCGGFICAFRFNHTICDGIGLVQFMRALGEIARGASQPSTLPVWRRELLNARDPPQITCVHGDYKEVSYVQGTIVPLQNMVYRSFFFGPDEVASICSQIPYRLRKSSSKFDIITAFLWRCHSMALELNDDDTVRIVCAVNARSKFNPPLPKGYYGNVIAVPMATTTFKELRRKPLGYALELVKKLKDNVNEEYMHSLADFVVIKGRPNFNGAGLLIVSDNTRVGYDDVDYGWGKPVYGCAPNAFKKGILYFRYKNAQGQEGIAVPLGLPSKVMKRFVKELEGMLTINFITSSL